MEAQDFASALEDKVTGILQNAVGAPSGFTPSVVSFWNVLQDFDITKDVPIVIVTARNATQRNQGEIGPAKRLWGWLVHIYYIDVDQFSYNIGRARRSTLVQLMKNAIEDNPRLDGLSVFVNPGQLGLGGGYECVYDSNFSQVIYDSSGQEGYFAFTTEMYLTVETERNDTGNVS